MVGQAVVTHRPAYGCLQEVPMDGSHLDCGASGQAMPTALPHSQVQQGARKRTTNTREQYGAVERCSLQQQLPRWTTRVEASPLARVTQDLSNFVEVIDP